MISKDLIKISQKCPWKQYRQPKNGRKIHNSSALYNILHLLPDQISRDWASVTPIPITTATYSRMTLG